MAIETVNATGLRYDCHEICEKLPHVAALYGHHEELPEPPGFDLGPWTENFRELRRCPGVVLADAWSEISFFMEAAENIEAGLLPNQLGTDHWPHPLIQAVRLIKRLKERQRAHLAKHFAKKE